MKSAMNLRYTLLVLCALSFGASEATPNANTYDFAHKLIINCSRTASARFPNGTYLDIAKIEGGNEYKAYMLSLQQAAPLIASPWLCPLPDHICQYWPMRSMVAQNPLDFMLEALVAAVEAALETRVESVSVAAHDLANVDARDVALALSRIGVESSHSPMMTREVIARTLGSKNTWLPPHPYILLQHFISVEYTRTSLTVFLLEESGGNVTVLGKVSSGKLGYDDMQACQATELSNTTSTICYAAQKAALRQMCKDTNQFNALDPDFGVEGQLDLSAIFLFGENACDQDLDTVLRDVLEVVWADGERDDLARVIEDLSPEPAFAGSRAMALADLKEKRLRQGQAKREYAHDEV